MLASVLSGALVGIDGLLVEVEVDVALGLPQFTTVGLPEGAVKESKDRVRSALLNCLIISNSAYWGAGLHNGYATNCIVQQNISDAQGGGTAAGSPAGRPASARRRAISASCLTPM